MSGSKARYLAEVEAIQQARAALDTDEMLHGIRKSQPLKTSVSEEDAKHLVERHGLTGPLPKNLDRNQRMAAYEARYVSSGGHKAQKYQHRANAAEKVRVASVGAGGLSAAAWMLSRGKNKASVAALKKVPHLQHHAEMSAAGSAVGATAGELYGAHARKKRSSYASQPAGVAASALRRMQAYPSQ